MIKDFELVSKRHEEIVKEAFVGAMARPFISAAKWAFKNPFKTLGHALTGAELATGAKQLSKSVTDYAAPIIQNTTGTF